MSEARKEILRLLAEERINLSEAEELLAALKQGYPEQFAASEGAGVPVAGARSQVTRATRGRQRSARGIQTDPSAKEVMSGNTPGSARRAHVEERDETRSAERYLEPRDAPPARSSREGDGGERKETSPISSRSPDRPPPPGSASILRLATSDSLELSGDATLRIEPRPGLTLRDEALTSVALRGLFTSRLSVVRGKGVEISQSGLEHVLTWPGGLLLLEIPNRLGALEIRNVAGTVGISGYLGPFAVEELDGPLTVHGPSSPFRVRGVRGLVRILGLALRDGISTIAQREGDVEIEAADDASVSIRAVSAEGGVSLGDGAGGGAAAQRRRGTWRLGAGTAQLNVSTIRGRIWLRRSPGPAGAGTP